MSIPAFIFILVVLFYPKLINNQTVCSPKTTNDVCIVGSIEEIVNEKFTCDNNSPFAYLVINNQMRKTFKNVLDFKSTRCRFYILILFNVNMINISSKIINTESSFDTLQIANSNFKFQDDKEQSFFSNVNYSIEFKSDTIYFPKLQPTIFKNSSVDSLYLYGLSNTTIKQNYFTFELSKNQSTHLNSRINRVLLDMFKIKLNTEVLNKYVFERTTTICIQQQVDGIEVETFKSLKYLKRLELKMMSFYKFFHQGTSWMRNLNSDVKINLNNSINFKNWTELDSLKLVFTDYWFNVPYIFPDEDFCLFNKFPHEHYVIPVTRTCSETCTFQWIVKYKHSYEPMEQECNFVKNCDFEILNSICIENFKKDQYQSVWQDASNGYNNLKVDLYYLNDNNYKIKSYNFVSIVLFPIICFLGILLNGLNVLVLANKAYKKEMKEKMYEQMKYSSLINLIICLIYLFRISIRCIDPVGYFCPIEAITNRTYRYMILTLINYFGNVFKTCSNILHILIAFHRFALSSKMKSSLTGSILKLNILTLFCYSFAFSCLLNCIKIFQFNYEFNYFVPFQFPTLFRNYFSFGHVYAYLNMLNIILCDFAYLLLQLIFDLKLLLFVQFSMSSKRLMISNQLNKKYSAEHSTEKKIKFMIILNGLFLFLIHSPNFVISIYSTTIYGHNMDMAGPDQVDEKGLFLFGFLYTDICDCIYFLGYLSDFAFYFYFNKVFRRSLRDLFTPKFKKNQTINSSK